MSTPAAGLLRLARSKAGMTQAELGDRAGVPASMISAYERDRRQPTLTTLLRLLKAAGYELRMHLVPYDDHDDAGRGAGAVAGGAAGGVGGGAAGEDRAGQAGDRGAASTPGAGWWSVREFDPVRIVEVLAAHEVEFVVIGGFAAELYQAPIPATQDIDITPQVSEENLTRLSAALEELGARVRTAGVPEGLVFSHDGSSLGRATIWNLTTTAGELDVTFRPSGTDGYEDLSADAVVVDVAGHDVSVAAGRSSRLLFWGQSSRRCSTGAACNRSFAGGWQLGRLSG